MSVRVMLVDDHEIVRQGLAALLDAEAELEVVGSAASVAEARRMVPRCSPDVALLDVRLPDGDGIDLCEELRTNHPDLRCMVLTALVDDSTLVDAAEAGASAFLVKELRTRDIIDAVLKVSRGEVLLDAAVVRLARERLRTRSEHLVSMLTPQEAKVFELIGEGASNRDIGEALHLAEKTVKNYVTVVLSKLGLRRRTEVAALAARLDERSRRRGGERDG